MEDKQIRMTSTSNYGFNQIDCNQDQEMLFEEYVTKDSKENWQKADIVIKNVENKIGEHVTVDGESVSNIDFISRDDNSIEKIKANGIYYIFRGEKGEKGDAGSPGTASVSITDDMINTIQTWSSEKIINKRYETDFVDILSNQFYFDKMGFVKIDTNNFYIYLENPSMINKYFFTAPDDYFKLSNCEVINKTTEFKNLNIGTSSGETNGNWFIGTNSQTSYAKTIGATFTCQFTMSSNSNTILINHFADNRGGIWEVDIDGGNKVEFSTYNNSTSELSKKIYQDISSGRHTLTMTFKGDDPTNPPSSGQGTSRGWTYKANSDNFIQISESITTEQSPINTLGKTSNKEFAFSISPIGSDNKQWIPQHATTSAFNKMSPVFVLNGREYNFGEFEVGLDVKFSNFKLIQNVYGRHVDSGDTNLVDIKTIHSIGSNGKINVTGGMLVLEDIKTYAGYVIMCPVNNVVFNRFKTGNGNVYRCEKDDNSNTYLTEKKDCKNYVFYSTTNDMVVAFRHTDIRNNLIYDENKFNLTSNFINHRDSMLVKHYIDINFDEIVRQGYKYLWSGDYLTGIIPHSSLLI